MDDQLRAKQLALLSSSGVRGCLGRHVVLGPKGQGCGAESEPTALPGWPSGRWTWLLCGLQFLKGLEQDPAI